MARPPRPKGRAAQDPPSPAPPRPAWARDAIARSRWPTREAVARACAGRDSTPIGTCGASPAVSPSLGGRRCPTPDLMALERPRFRCRWKSGAERPGAGALSVALPSRYQWEWNPRGQCGAQPGPAEPAVPSPAGAEPGPRRAGRAEPGRANPGRRTGVAGMPRRTVERLQPRAPHLSGAWKPSPLRSRPTSRQLLVGPALCGPLPWSNHLHETGTVPSTLGSRTLRAPGRGEFDEGLA